jgi:hypothetical protein
MPSVRKMSVEEASAIENKGKGKRKFTKEEYDHLIADFDSGDYGEVLLEASDNRLTVRNRLKAAAKRRGLGIVFRRTRGDAIRFKLEESSQAKGSEAEPVAVEALPIKRRGRKKKTEA